MNAYTRGNITYYGYNMVQVIKPTVWLTAERFAAWLVEFKVIEVCLGERVNDRVFDVHLEGLKRLPTIVKFLAQQGLLSLPHLRRFWKISTEMGDTIKRAVFDVLASAAKYLTEEHFDALFEAIGAVTVADIDAPLLTLITTLTKHALVAAADPSKTYGVELLWKAVSAPAGLQEDVVVQAEKSFIDMFQQRPDLVQPYAERCGRNIQEQVSVVKSLKLLVELLKTLPVVAQSRRAAGPAASGEFASQETAVSHLLHTLDIASVVVKDLQAYKAAAVEAAGKAGLPVPSPDSTGGEALVLLKPDTHLSAIKARLDFLGFVYSTADVVPADDTLDILWTELVLRNVTAAEREAFFEWLKAIIEQSSLRAAVDGPNHVDTWFGRYFANPAQLRTSSLGLQGFAAFEAAFRAVNVNGNKLRASAVVMVFDSDLLGLDALWSVAVEALNPDVFKLAVELLIALHTKLSPQLTVNKRAVWEAFVVKCMTFVQRALVQLQAGAATPQEQLLYERHIEAALGLLQRFLSVVEDAGRKSREGYSVPWTITYSYRDGDVTKTIYLPENPTVGQVRTEAAAKIQFTPDRCRVQSKDRKSHYSCEEWDDKYYEATGMSAGTATCMPCVSPMVDTEQYDESRIFPKADMTDLDRTRPRELLSNTPEYFEALFEVLSLKRDSVVASSWSLIQLLPNNDRVMHSITAVQAAEATDLAALLNPSAPLKLLYTLRIVDKFVNPPAKDTAEEKAAAKDWCTAFAAKGGVTHLLKVFETCDIDGWLQSTLPQTCLSLLVKIIVAFLAPDRRADTIAALADVNAEAVTHRLFRAVEAAVRAAAVSVKRSDDDDGGVFEVKDEGALALAKKKKTKGRDAGTGGGDLDDDDPLELKESTEDEPSTDTFSSTDGLLESKLAPSTRESQLVQHSLALYSILALAVDAVRPVFVSEGVSQTLLAGLLKVPDVALRVEVEKGLSQLVAGLVLRGGSVAERDRFLQLLISNIDTAYNFDGSCTEFFSLLSRLLKLKPDVPPALDVSALLARLSELTSVHPILEVTVEQEDFLFRGLLCATASLLNAYPKLKDSATGLVTEVFHNCLFAVPTATTPRDSPPPKCKHATSRKIAFAFLEELAKGCPANMALLCEQMTPHHASPAVTVSKKGYSLPALPKSSTGYVGLKNLGCICYMNATVQNFFMVPEFRQGVLSYDDTEEDKKESLMFQLQRMFAFLQETDKQCYNPKGFCHAFKDWEGNPTNTFVQKDASEFLGMLFQQMEMMLQGSPQEHVLKQCFGGTHQNELIADGKYSAREEPFTFLSVDIKNKKDLYSALRGFISGETVDYKWENEDGSKVELPTQKRTSIKTPPQHLIVHLKRFEFDYETMQNSKLNDRFEFPRELDLWEFTAAGRPDKVARPEAKEEEVKEEEAVLAVPEDRDDFKYELAGVVIHSGTAHAGHYYSFIRERVGKLGRWMMFNDSSVTPFNPDYLEREAFGGVETYKYAYTGVTQQHSITRNAFILFYDRVPKEAVAAAPEAPLIGTESAFRTELVAAAELADKLLKAHRAKAVQQAVRANIPPAIYEAITSDNIGFWRERNIYDKTYFAFLSNLLQGELGGPALGDAVGYPATPAASHTALAEAGGPSFRVVRLATLFVINTLATSTHKAQWKVWVQRLQGLYERNVVACVWLLQVLISNDQLLSRVLFDVDEGLAKLLGTVLSVVLAAEAPLPSPADVALVPARPRAPPPLARAGSGDLTVEASQEPPSDDLPAPHGAVGVTFVESLLALLPSAAAQWTKNSQYFSLLGSLCATSGSAPSPPAVVQYLKQRGLISILVGFYLDGESPIPKYNVSPAADVAETAAATQAAANRAMWDAMDGIRVTGNRHETYTTTYSSGAVVTYPRKGKMGNAYYAADFRPVLACIKELVLSSLPPSGAPSALQLPPAQPLSPDDVTMLSSNQFLTKLLSTDAAGTVPIARSLISHIVWNNEELSARIAGVIQAGIVAADGEAIVPWFKALGELFAIQDDLKDARLSALLGGVVAAMHSQQNYYRATETSIIQFVALGKHNTLFRQWVWANKASARWMLDWLRTNVRPPAYYQPGPMKLNKVQQTYFGAGAEPTLRTPALTERMAALLDGRAVTYADFDPLDDQDSIVGKRIAILLATHKWYLGRVDLYDPTTGKHVVRFDDKDVVAYNLHGKTVYKFVREGIQLNPWYAPPATDEAPFTVVVPAVAPAVAGEPPAAASQPDEEEELEPGQEEEEEDEQQLGYRHTYHQQGVVEEVSSDEGAFDDQEDRNDP